ncbi:MAG: hypothetical protein KGL53_11590 [Elusimicrobia bacterium]|nr:hypothetical protein [Elusimicrobiota bacterium]
MKPEARARHKAEMAFFKNAQTLYNAALDDCGDIRKSLALLKKQLAEHGTRLPPAKWSRLYGVLMSGEVVRGKRCTAGDWAANEAKLLRVSDR